MIIDWGQRLLMTERFEVALNMPAGRLTTVIDVLSRSRVVLGKKLRS
jgi:hypothetical protein